MEERIYVSVRLRPLNGKEIFGHDVSDWECINDTTIVYKNATLSASERSMYPTAYTFDRVFRCDCSTREVYEQGAKDVAISAVSGINASVFAYGQTSSGKTYTMSGITEYAIADIYEYIEKHPEREFVLKFSAIEIYNESVRDLLSVDTTPLRLLDDPERGTIVEKLTEETLRDWNHVVHLLSLCDAQRQIGETCLNEMSSRSHQIIRMTIESSSREFLVRENASTISATVNFVDLAGSERASQSLSAGTRLKEGCHINRSLLTLGTVIRKLSKGRNGHVPYRDSKLTRILQTSLGGNARTAIICTMSPARRHVEQSRNTLLFASCSKEVVTNAKVNVVMSDKALVKLLQKELERLENDLRNPQSAPSSPSNYPALLREKDLQIEKLQEKINDLILQRDIAQSQVKDLLQMLQDNVRSEAGVGSGRDCHLRVQRALDAEIPEEETSILADPYSVDADTGTFSDGHSRTSSHDHILEFDDSYAQGGASPSGSYSNNVWEVIEKQSNKTSEDLCKEVRCIESEESSKESNCFPSPENVGFPEDKLHVDEEPTESLSTPPSGYDQESKPFSLKSDTEMEDIVNRTVTSKKTEEVIPKPMQEVKAISPRLRDEAEEVCSQHFLDMSSLTYETNTGSSVHTKSKLTKSRSCDASVTDSSSPWFKMMHFNENTPSLGSGGESIGFKTQSLSRNHFHQLSPGNALDIGIDTPNPKFATSDDSVSCNTETRDNTNGQSIDHCAKADESPKKNVKDVGLDPIEDDPRALSSWSVEFGNIQQELIELWHACNVSLVHRTYFFILFQGDPSDAIYLEVEMRRLKFLKDKFTWGDETVVNGRRLTLASSARALNRERQMLSKRMMKKLPEHERESLFLKWGIGLNTKHRRLQLAHSLWTKTRDMDHISDSAFLIAKLIGFLEPGQAPSKELFGLNFTPRCTTRSYSFRRTLVSLL